MAADHPRKPTLPVWLTSDDFERLESPTVRELLHELSPSHPEVVPELFSALDKIFDQVAWFGVAINERTDLATFRRSADHLKRGAGNVNQWRDLKVHWPEATLLLALGLDNKPDGFAELLALLVLALIDQSREAGLAPSRSAVEQFAQQIRGIALRATTHPDRGAIFDLNLATNWRACVAHIADNFRRLGDEASEQGKAWAARWSRWADQSLAKASKPAVSTAGSADREPIAPRSARASSGKWPRTRRKITETRQGIRAPVRSRVLIPPPADEVSECPEPIEEATARESILSPETPIDGSLSESAATSKAASKRACFQAIRLRNSDLSTQHIEVLNDAELAVLIPALLERLDASLACGEFIPAAAWSRYLLVIALGRDPERVESIPFYTQDRPAETDQLWIDLATGHVWCPVLKPDGGAKPNEDIQPDVEPTFSEFALPLPPSLVRRLEKLARLVGKTEFRLVDFIDPKLDRKSIAKLGSDREILTVSQSFSRARRVLATRVQAQAHDLALTMLICGDTLGRSNAPLYYYAPKTDVLAENYRRAVWPHYGDSPTPQPPRDNCPRVGSQIVPRESVVLQGFRTLDRQISDAHTDVQDLGIGALARYHNLFTVSVTCRFALITTERPTGRKFSLKRDQIDTAYRLVVVDDKRVDAEHAVRVAALSPELADQLDRYFRHLAAMSNHADVPDALRKQALDAVESRAPLFFFIDEATLRQRPASLDEWVSKWPPQWSRFPRNWYRHYFATRAREFGASPLLVLAQCGHLESARHPFTQSSSLSAIEMSRRLGAPLSRLERSLGIRKRNSPLIQDEPPDLPVPPLRSWRKDLADHQSTLGQIELKRLQDIALMLRQNQQRALQVAQKLAVQHCESLGELISADLSETEPDPDLPVKVTSTFTPKVAAQLSRSVNELGGPSIFQLAVRRQLWRRIRSVSLKHRLNLPDIGWGFVGSRAEYSPFPINGLLALRQMSSLRAEFIARSEILKQRNPSLHFLLNLVLLAGICDRDEIDRLLSDARPIGIVRQGQPRLLLEVGLLDNKTVVGFSGAAAVVCAYQDTWPAINRSQESTALCRDLRREFPGWFKTCPLGSEIGILIETREVASRFDLSGAARFMGSTEGSTPADRDGQIRILTNDASAVSAVQPPRDNGSEALEAVEDPSVSRTITDAKKDALDFYNHQLLPALGGGSGRDINDRRTTLESQRRNLDQLTTGLQRSPWIEHRLALFAQELANTGTNNRAELAASTVVTYVTSIARPLIDRLAGVDLREYDADDFTGLYVQILEEHRESATALRTGSQLLAFHRQLMHVFGFDPVDTTALYPYLNTGPSLVTTAAVTESEFRRAWLYLRDLEQARVDPDGESIPRDVRTLRIARLLLMLLHRTGARFREILFLRHEDIWVRGTTALAWIRSTLHRSLKSPNARRLCDLSDQILEDELTELGLWLQGERARAGSRYRPSQFVFDRSSLNDPLIPTVTEVTIRKLLRDAFWFTSGRQVWPHLLRHGWADRALRTFLDGLGNKAAPDEPAVRQLDLRLIGTQLGHGSIETTIQNYLHAPWLVRTAETRDADIDLGRKDLASLSNRSLAAIDKIRQRPLTQAKARFMESVDTLTERVLVQSGQPLMPTRVASDFVEGDRAIVTAVPSLPFPHFLALRRHRTTDAIGYALGVRPDQLGLIRAHGTRCSNNELTTDVSEIREDSEAIARWIDRFGVSMLAETLQRQGRDAQISLTALFKRVQSKRISERERAFAGRRVDIDELQIQMAQLGISGLIRIPPESTKTKELWRLTFERHSDEKTPFGLLESILEALAERQAIFLRSGS